MYAKIKNQLSSILGYHTGYNKRKQNIHFSNLCKEISKKRIDVLKLGKLQF